VLTKEIKIEKMKKERSEDGKKRFVGTFESSKHTMRREPKEMAIEKIIKKLIKRCKIRK